MFCCFICVCRIHPQRHRAKRQPSLHQYLTAIWGGKGVIFGLLHSENTQRKYIKFILYRQEAVLFFGHFCLFLGIDRETDKVKSEN